MFFKKSKEDDFQKIEDQFVRALKNSSLTEMEKSIVYDRIIPGTPLSEIAKKNGISEERARVIFEEECLPKLATIYRKLGYI